MIITHTSTEPLILFRAGLVVPMHEVMDGEVFKWWSEKHQEPMMMLWKRIGNDLYHPTYGYDADSWTFNSRNYFPNMGERIKAYIVRQE